MPGPRLYIITLILFALFFGIGGKVYLCLSPHGDVHLAGDHATCGSVTRCAGHGCVSSPEHHREQCQSHCRDIALGGDEAQLPEKNTVQVPAPALLPLTVSVPLATLAVRTFHRIPLVLLPQPALRQSVVLLI